MRIWRLYVRAMTAFGYYGNIYERKLSALRAVWMGALSTKRWSEPTSSETSSSTIAGLGGIKFSQA